MTWPLTILSGGFALILLGLIFRPLELAFPAKRGQKLLRPSWGLDLSFFTGQYLLWNGLVLTTALVFAGWVYAILPENFRRAVVMQPWWLQAIEAIIIGDFCVYWGHRLQHSNRLLWKFHRVHHSSEHLDWLAAHREHPIDTIYTMMLTNVPVILLGFPMSTLAGLVAFRALWAVYIHSNCRIPIGPLKWFIGAPELHHWHHDRDPKAGNYANLSPMMDILFGTYKCPDHEPESFGTDEHTATTYVGHMLQPFGRDKKRGDEPDAVELDTRLPEPSPPYEPA